MREVLSHRPGRIFLGAMAFCAAGMIAAAWTFDRGILVFGWVPLPFALGLAFTAATLAGAAVYLFGYWPYR